tara:strand:- start:3721 stop:4323 length:603 start_codon:yes stop_codon:yes gene_type:complete
MAKLNKACNNFLVEFEDNNLGMSLLSYLVLDWHVNTDNHESWHKALREFYGYTHSQLGECYEELEFDGYLLLKYDFLSFTPKAMKLFNVNRKKVTPADRIKQEVKFNSYWSLVPHKIGKKKALYEWMKIMPSDELCKVIIEAVTTQLAYVVKMKSLGKFVPELQSPERWIKNERWTDEVEKENAPNVLTIKRDRKGRDER